MEPIFRVVRRQTIEDEIIVYARGAGAASPGAQNSARMAKRQSTIPTSPASRRKPRPKPAETFPWGWMWGSALALLIFALGLLAPGDTWKLPYAIGVVAGIFFALTGLSFQWRQSHMAAGVRAADKLCRALKACGAGFGLLFIVFIGITIWVWLIAATVRPLQLIPHHPWDVQYGDTDGFGKKRVYVHARADNTTKGTITFQAYGKATLTDTPSSIALLQNPETINALRDKVTTLASGVNAPVITSEPHAEEPATFDIPAPPGPKSDYDAWRSGDKVLYYFALVYVKADNGNLRLASRIARSPE